jgi:hypothetical protein
MSDEPRTEQSRQTRTPCNKGKLTGPKLPRRVREIWAIRIRVQLGGSCAPPPCSTSRSTASCAAATRLPCAS